MSRRFPLATSCSRGTGGDAAKQFLASLAPEQRAKAKMRPRDTIKK